MSNATNQPTKPVLEFHPAPHDSKHRLVCGDQATVWAGYRSITYLNGFVGCTAYYHAEGVHTAEDWCKSNAVSALVGN